ncbi:response regulator [Pseudodesulfovibrio piezophilus]|uniref:Response regulator receiver protein n=1 Tax=Pseudodesulfovibrio piezophilus (strain DSM 21447 / JCM 15486 / C1TLV30) TaxID=1322246 RepID=M1WRF8_PSEP2|nr:response regulator [Pseudodesulfovibrio piezophilus]CCH49514.1 Response regulator receiver protein [Pseudodesulfovibrio piezophilus C1TLV30]
MKILLVDDEVELVSAMAERLALRGLDVAWTDNGEKALEIAADGTFDVAVLDMKMPKLGGLELRRLLSEKHPQMKFIFLSGHGSEADYKAGTAAATCYLIKPVDLEELMAKIQCCDC